MTNGDGVNYSVKELISRLDEKLDKIDAKLDQKAEAAEVASLTSRVIILENQVVRRDGPLIAEIKTFEQKVDSIEKKVEINAERITAVQRYRRALFAATMTIIGLSISVTWLIVTILTSGGHPH